MRRLLSVILALAVLAIAGCGGGGDSGSALDSALSVLPKDAPFAVAIDTDLDGDQWAALDKLVAQVPLQRSDQEQPAGSSSSSRAAA